MKEMSLAVFGVVALALLIGLLFFAVYPRVEPSAELAALFVFLALLLRWLGVRLWGWLHKPAAGSDGKAPR